MSLVRRLWVFAACTALCVTALGGIASAKTATSSAMSSSSGMAHSTHRAMAKHHRHLAARHRRMARRHSAMAARMAARHRPREAARTAWSSWLAVASCRQTMAPTP